MFFQNKYVEILTPGDILGQGLYRSNWVSMGSKAVWLLLSSEWEAWIPMYRPKPFWEWSEKIAIYKSGSRNLGETNPPGMKFLGYQSLELEEQILCRNRLSLVFVLKASMLLYAFCLQFSTASKTNCSFKNVKSY